MHDNVALAKLARKVVLAEIAARGASDPEAVEAIIGPRLRLDISGEFVALDHKGKPLTGAGLADVLDDVEKSLPMLFGKSNQSETTSGTRNPFAEGLDKNVTAQMLLWRTDPEKAEKLASEAGFTLGRS